MTERKEAYHGHEVKIELEYQYIGQRHVETHCHS
jgi:hypothetical protein